MGLKSTPFDIDQLHLVVALSPTLIVTSLISSPYPTPSLSGGQPFRLRWRLYRYRTKSRRQRKYQLVLDADVVLVYGNKAGNCFSERFNAGGFQASRCEVPLSQLFHSLRGEIRPSYDRVREVQASQWRPLLRQMHLTQTRKQ